MDSDSKGSGRGTKRSALKKVSFSIFEVNTFEEIAKIRKIREEELDNFILNKRKTNQYFSLNKYKNNLKHNLSKSNQKTVKKDTINKNNKENYSLKNFLTDEDNESFEKSSQILQPKINELNKKKIIEKRNIEKFIKKITNIFHLNNNKIKRKQLNKEIFLKLKNYNEYLINKYLDYENNDLEFKNFIENKTNFFMRKIL